MSPKKLLFVFRRAPYNSPIAQEGLDALLAAAVFDQEISVLFMGDGVFQLTQNQAPQAGTSHQKKLQALPMYDVERIFVDEASLTERHLSQSELNLPCEILNSQDIQHLLTHHDHILSF